MSDCDSFYIGPSRWVVNHCYNHRASISQRCFFLFLPSLMIFSRAWDATRDDQLSGYWLSNHCSRFDFHSFIIFFPCWRTAENPVNSFLNHISLVPKGAQLLKFSMVPVSVGFWYHPQLIFLLLLVLICKSKKSNFTFVFGVSIVNCQFECSKCAARGTFSGSPFNVLTISST